MEEWMYRSWLSLTSVLLESEWSVSLPGRFVLGEKTHDCLGFKAGLDDMEK
jgi:hypothetical protein